jgi:large conductance mechanosensitive channel
MPSAAKGAVLIMSEKKTSGIKNFFEEFKAFAMRGNVLDMAVGVVVGSAFTAIVNSLVNDIISPIIGLFFNADFSDVVIQIGDVGIGVGAFLNAIINFLIVAFVLFLTIKAINMLHKKPVESRRSPPPRNAPTARARSLSRLSAAPTALRSSRASPKQSCNFPCFLPGVSALWTPPGLFCALFSRSRKENQNFFEKSIAFSGESWYYIRVVTTQQNMDG